MGTVSNNIALFGVGGLNINGTRIKLAEDDDVSPGMANLSNRRGETGVDWRKTTQEKMAQAQKDSVERTKTLGRWPANLILQHSPLCQCKGFKKVKSSNASLLNTAPGRDIGLVTLPGLKRINGMWGHADEDNMETVPDWDCVSGCPISDLDQQGDPVTISRYFKQVKS